MHIVIDIETCPSQDPAVKAEILANVKAPGQYKKADSIAEWMRENGAAEGEEQWRKTSFDGALGHICVIGVSFDNGNPIALYSENWAQDEKEILRQFYDLIDSETKLHPTQRPVFVGHNLIDFDLRFIFQRSVVLGVKPSAQIPFSARPWDDSVYDTMTRWAGTKDRISLNKAAKAVGLKGKGDIDGSQVWEYVSSGRIKEIADYCKNDIELTRALYERMTFQF